MTVYAKIENNKLITAYNGYNGIIGLADSVELCELNGFNAYTEEEVAGYYSGTHKPIDGILVDIRNTPEFIQEQNDLTLENLSTEYTTIKCERMVSWVNSFINSITTASTIDDIKAKAIIFKNKSDSLLNGYLADCEEVNNG